MSNDFDKTPTQDQLQAALNDVGKGFNENPLLRTSHAETIHFALRFTAKALEKTCARCGNDDCAGTEDPTWPYCDLGQDFSGN